MTKAKEGEFVPGYALHEFPFFIWYTYPQLLLKNAAPRPGSFFDRHGGSILGRRQHAHSSASPHHPENSPGNQGFRAVGPRSCQGVQHHPRHGSQVAQTLYLPLDDLLYITRQYINADVSRSGLARLLKREGMARLEDLIPAAEGETIKPKKTFKDYEPGFVHIDIKYLPQMPDETSRRYLFVAIDRATRWVFLHIYHDMSDTSSIDFLRRLKEASPIKISKILTDNGSQFTDRFTSKDKKPSGRHVFDKVCTGMGIEHRLAPPRHPQTNGMVERFNGRINELLQQTRFDSQADLEKTLHNYLKLYNHHIPQRAIDSKTPIQALKEWQRQKPELFVKRVYEQTGLDT